MLPSETPWYHCAAKNQQTSSHSLGTRRRMTPLSIVVWFSRAYDALGLDGCSSHSGRRTFITRAARSVHKAGGSLRDVQLVGGAPVNPDHSAIH